MDSIKMTCTVCVRVWGRNWNFLCNCHDC